eukprot:TRINITY_DN14655_c0_g3_i1.p1 TRINITY_DN14655_c0_g3~~TRINITY_DN14655_c0_g3_i1.p1  ORF type:complete len:347 (+),score=109.02 TRINITY_DN14655_c0_g3_i1:92-1132(+)
MLPVVLFALGVSALLDELSSESSTASCGVDPIGTCLTSANYPSAYWDGALRGLSEAQDFIAEGRQTLSEAETELLQTAVSMAFGETQNAKTIAELCKFTQQQQFGAQGEAEIAKMSPTEVRKQNAALRHDLSVQRDALKRAEEEGQRAEKEKQYTISEQQNIVDHADKERQAALESQHVAIQEKQAAAEKAAALQEQVAALESSAAKERRALQEQNAALESTVEHAAKERQALQEQNAALQAELQRLRALLAGDSAADSGPVGALRAGSAGTSAGALPGATPEQAEWMQRVGIARSFGLALAAVLAARPEDPLRQLAAHLEEPLAATIPPGAHSEPAGRGARRDGR